LLTGLTLDEMACWLIEVVAVAEADDESFFPHSVPLLSWINLGNSAGNAIIVSMPSHWSCII
jgi:hypothetical protein